MLSCSILIPTFNGLEILEECLPSMLQEVEARDAGDEIIILDNASTDGTCEFLERDYPDVRILRLSENKAIFALNDGAREAKNPYLFFLNNDMILKPGCIAGLLEPFRDESVFAVTGKVYQWDRSTVQAGRRIPAWGKGYYWYLGADTDEPGITVHALGGQSIFDRAKFLELGGIDPLFSPFYYEDLDLSWRALRRGWKILYTPDAEMIHRGAATAGKVFTKDQIKTIMQKNLFLFMWKNLHDGKFTRAHIMWLLPRLLKETLRGNMIFAAGLSGAVKQLPDALKARRAACDTTLSDAEVIRLFEGLAPLGDSGS